MKLSLKVATTSKTVNVFIQDSSSTTGAGLAGLAYNTASLIAYYALPRAASVAITLATLSAVTSAWSSGGFKEIDATHMPGWYRLDIPDAALASGAFVSLHLQGATNMVPLPIEIELTGWDNQDATGGGLSRLDAAVTSRMATFTLPTNFSSLVIDGSGRVDLSKVSGTSQTARDLGASVLLSSGTGTGQISLSSGTVTVGTNNDKTGYTASTVSDKTGYALTSAYDPAKSASQAGDAMTLTSGERNSIADAHLDRSNAIETGLTPRGATRLIVAGEAAKMSGLATTTVTIRNAVADSKDRIVATVDAYGNRTAVTTDVS